MINIHKNLESVVFKIYWWLLHYKTLKYLFIKVVHSIFSYQNILYLFSSRTHSTFARRSYSASRFFFSEAISSEQAAFSRTHDHQHHEHQ